MKPVVPDLMRFKHMRPLLVVARKYPTRWSPLLERICERLRDDGVPVLQVSECPDGFDPSSKAYERSPGIARINVPTATRWQRHPLGYALSRRRFRECVAGVIEAVSPRAMVFQNFDLAGTALSLGRQFPDLPLVYWASELSCAVRQAPFRRYERLVAPRLAGLVMNNPDRVRILKERMKRDVPSIMIPNTETRLPEGHVFERAPAREMFKEHNPDVRVILIYMGIVSHKQAVLDLIEALPLVPEHIGLAFPKDVGDPAYLAKIEEAVKRLGLERRVIHPAWVPYDKTAELAASGDIGVALLRVNDLNTKYCASGKLYRYLSAGLPVIASNLPALSDVVLEANMGVVCDEDSREDIARAIMELADDARRKELARNVEDAFRNRLSLEALWEAHRGQFLDWIAGGRELPRVSADEVAQACSS